MSVGPLGTPGGPGTTSLAPGESLTVQFAFVIGNGLQGLIDNMTQAQLIRDGLWFDCDGDPNTGVDGKECHVPDYSQHADTC